MNGSKLIAFGTKHLAIYSTLVLGLFILVYSILHQGLLYGVIVSSIPLIIILSILFFQSPYWGLMSIVIGNYFIMGIGRYLPISSIGLVIDGLFILTFFVLLLKACYLKIEWKNIRNDFTLAASIWLIYCLLEVFNPQSVSFRAWATSIRLMSFYIFLIAILVPTIFHRYKDLKIFIFTWSFLTLLAVLKALYQKEFGFDASEMRWLYIEGKASTHILSTGIRYFSFFTDAANFGSGMGLSLVVFTIVGLHTQKLFWKVYYILIGLLAGYGMMISGTRSTMIIPFAGFSLYLLLSKNLRVILLGGVGLVFAFYFFAFTTIGQRYAEIRRMRSAFRFEQDASFNVRIENQKKISTYMADKPFGVGIGLGGGKALVNAPNLFTAQIPTDSWFVVLWEETGVVGLVLYLSLFFLLIIRGGYNAMFRIKNRQLKFLMISLLSGTFGLLVSSYSNEVIAQFPNGIIVYISMAFVFMGKKFDADIEEATPKLAAHEK